MAEEFIDSAVVEYTYYPDTNTVYIETDPEYMHQQAVDDSDFNVVKVPDFFEHDHVFLYMHGKHNAKAKAMFKQYFIVKANSIDEAEEVESK